VTDRAARPPAPDPLPHPVVDNHCHLDITWDGAEELPAPEALRLAAAVGVPRIVQIGCDLEGARWAERLAGEVPGIVAGVALHPNEAPVLAAQGAYEQVWQEIATLARSPQVRAVGETGLDFYRTPPEGRAAQEESFRRHVRLAAELGKTLVIHDRDAHGDVLRVMDDEQAPERVVMHCFSGDAAFARACLDRDYWLSFAGTLTFKSAGELRDACRVVPSDRLLVETDAPFLTPTPYRGRANASYLVPLTMRALAEERGDDLEELCAAVEASTFAAFGGPWPAADDPASVWTDR
jgi:TatD DNase family protein